MAQTHTTLPSLFTAIASAIRSKTGTSSAIVADKFPDYITTVYNAGNTAAKVGTASAADVRTGKTFTNLSTVGATGTMTDATTGTASNGAAVSTITPTTSAQYVNITSGYTAARYWTIDAIQTETKTITPSTAVQTASPSRGKYLSSVTVKAISTETKSTTATTATQTVNATSGKYMTAVTVNPQVHSSVYKATKIVANTRIDLSTYHNYRYIDFYGYDYNLCDYSNGGSNQIKFSCPWNGTGANFYYGYWKVPSKFYLRCMMFHGVNNRMHGYLDGGGMKFHTRVDDVTWGFTLKNSATAQTTWNATNYGWYRGTFNGGALYPNSTFYVASNVASPSIKGSYGGYYVS